MGRLRNESRSNDATPGATIFSAEASALAELRGLRADVRELIAVLKAQQAAPPPPDGPESLPPMMTLTEAAEMLHTTVRSLYARIRRGTMPGVVRVGSRRLMVKTDEFLRDLPRMPTVE